MNRWQVEQLKEGRTKFTLGPYRIVNAIGQGGMGHVFKAEHKLLGRIEAIKVLPKSKSTPEAVAAFQREIRARRNSIIRTWCAFRMPTMKANLFLRHRVRARHRSAEAGPPQRAAALPDRGDDHLAGGRGVALRPSPRAWCIAT